MDRQRKGFRAIPKAFHPLSLAHGDGQFQDVLAAFGGRVTSLGEEFIAKGLQGVLHILAHALQDTGTQYRLAEEAHPVIGEKGCIERGLGRPEIIQAKAVGGEVVL